MFWKAGRKAFVAAAPVAPGRPYLSAASTDADQVAAALAAADFAVSETGGSGDPTVWEAGFGAFVASLAPGDLAVVYFAGHVAAIGGVNHLLLSGSRLEPSGGLRGAPRLRDLVGAIEARGARGLLLIDDARGAAVAPYAVSGGGTAVLLAAAPGTQAACGPQDPSPFAAAVVEVLGRTALSDRDLASEIADGVAEKSHGAQRPWLAGAPSAAIAVRPLWRLRTLGWAAVGLAAGVAAEPVARLIDGQAQIVSAPWAAGIGAGAARTGLEAGVFFLIIAAWAATGVHAVRRALGPLTLLAVLLGAAAGFGALLAALAAVPPLMSAPPAIAAVGVALLAAVAAVGAGAALQWTAAIGAPALRRDYEDVALGAALPLILAAPLSVGLGRLEASLTPGVWADVAALLGANIALSVWGAGVLAGLSHRLSRAPPPRAVAAEPTDGPTDGPTEALRLGAAFWPSIALAGAALLWAGNFTVGRALAGVIEPIPLAFLRWVLAVLVFAPVGALAVVQAWPAVRRTWLWSAAGGATGVAAFQSLVYLGVETTPVFNALLIVAATPVVILFWTAALAGRIPKSAQLIGSALSLIGAVVLIARGDLDRLAAFAFKPGDLWLVTAVFVWAAYTLLLRAHPKDLPPAAGLFASMSFGAVFLAPLAIPQMMAAPPPLERWDVLAGVAYVAIFASLAAFVLWGFGVRRLGPVRAGQFLNLMPLFGAALGVVLLGEALEPYHAPGAALVLIGVVLVNRRTAPPQAPAPGATRGE